MERGVLQGQPIESFMAAGGITDVPEQSRQRYVDALKTENQLSYTIILISNSAPLKDSTNKELLVKSYFH